VDDLGPADEDGSSRVGPTPPPPPLLAPLVWGIEQVVRRATGRPATVRWDTGAFSALRGRVERLTVGVTHVRIGSLVLDRVVLTVRNATLRPGLTPRLVSGPVEAQATVTQAAIDAWVGESSLPLRLHLTEDGLRSTAGIGSFRVVDVLTALTVYEGWLRLRPIEAVGRSVPDVLAAAFTGNLPLPALPEDAELLDVQHRAGSMVARVALSELDESLDPGVAGRLRTRLAAVEDPPEGGGSGQSRGK
jgi:hypothetical protein